MSTRTRLDRLTRTLSAPTPGSTWEEMIAEVLCRLDGYAPADGITPLNAEEMSDLFRTVMRRAEALGEPTDGLRRLADEWGVTL